MDRFVKTLRKAFLKFYRNIPHLFHSQNTSIHLPQYIKKQLNHEAAHIIAPHGCFFSINHQQRGETHFFPRHGMANGEDYYVPYQCVYHTVGYKYRSKIYETPRCSTDPIPYHVYNNT